MTKCETWVTSCKSRNRVLVDGLQNMHCGCFPGVITTTVPACLTYQPSIGWIELGAVLAPTYTDNERASMHNHQRWYESLRASVELAPPLFNYFPHTPRRRTGCMRSVKTIVKIGSRGINSTASTSAVDK